MDRIQNFIDGEFVPASTGRRLENIEPATGKAYSSVPDSGEDDVDRAVAAAGKAFPGWSRTSAEERGRILTRIAEAIESNADRLARAESIDTGKPMRLARSLDIPRSAKNFRFFASAIQHFHSESYATDHLAINYTLRRPRGVAGLISPWNLPLYLLSWKLAFGTHTDDSLPARRDLPGCRIASRRVEHRSRRRRDRRSSDCPPPGSGNNLLHRRDGDRGGDRQKRFIQIQEGRPRAWR